MFVAYYLERTKNREEPTLNKTHFHVKGHVTLGSSGYVVAISFPHTDSYWLTVSYDVML